MSAATRQDGAPSLVERVRRGDDPQLSLLAARGVLPLPQAQLIPLQVRIARGDDGALAAQARRSLLEIETRLLAPFLTAGAGEAVLEWFARNSDEPRLIEALLRRRDVPRHLLLELAPRLDPDLQEILVLRQDAIVLEPKIVLALEENPRLTSYVRRRIGEYREHLLPRERPRPVDAAPAAVDEPSAGDVAAALEQARRQPADGERDESTGLTEAQIRYLPVPVRLMLARGAPRALRHILIRDPNPTIARAVIRNNTFSDQELEQIASNRNVDDEVLAEIGAHREWVGKYRIAQALVQNPRTPLALAIKLVPRMSVRDLRMLSRDRNIPDAVRSTARRLYTIKRV
jgi:hypothetical protein